MKDILIIVMTGILTNNYVLFKFMGVCPFLGATSRNRSALYMSAATGVTMIVSSALTWLLWNKVMVPFGIEYLRTLVFLFTIAAVVAVLELLLKIFKGEIAKGMGIYLPLIPTNCAVLGLCVTNVTEGYSLGVTLANGFGSALGFALAMVMFSGVRERIERSNIPESFRGAPISLLAAAIVSLSFIGFSGLSVGLFGM